MPVLAQYTALRDTLGAEYAQVDKSRFRICVRYINEAKTKCAHISKWIRLSSRTD